AHVAVARQDALHREDPIRGDQVFDHGRGLLGPLLALRSERDEGQGHERDDETSHDLFFRLVVRVARFVLRFGALFFFAARAFFALAAPGYSSRRRTQYCERPPSSRPLGTTSM